MIYDRGEIRILGESEDISFGQLLDRIGNKLGFDFPAGEMMDRLALKFAPSETYANILPVIKVDGFRFNLSGIETAAAKLVGDVGEEELAHMLLERVFECIKKIIANLEAYAEDRSSEGEFDGVLFSGGVSSSEFIRTRAEGSFDIKVFFSDPKLSSDNAVGTAFLGGDLFWRENR